MADYLKNLICPACRSELNYSLYVTKEILCAHCGQAYPLISNRIPVLLDDPARFLSNWYLQYEQYLREQQLEIHKIDAAPKVSAQRASTLTKIKTAIQQNVDYVSSIQDSLSKHVSVRVLTSLIGEREIMPYATNWSYLQRDWSWLPEGELEISTIKQSLLDAVNKCRQPLEYVLVLGAGTGRIAWELCDVCTHVYATDNGLTMAHQFYDLLDRDISFSEINRNNIFNPDDSVRSLRASLYPPRKDFGELDQRRKKLSYFVADGLNTPLQDHSISAIVSVYFTELVPMKAFIHEIKRLLKHDGMFLHFGPLEYQLPNLSDHLSAAEIKATFVSQGFVIGEDKQVRSTHLASDVSMSTTTYKNWVFTAINQNVTNPAPDHEITLNSVLAVVEDVQYQIQGSISTDDEKLNETSLLLPSGEKFVGAKSVLDILRALNGVRRNYEVIEILSQDYETTDESSRKSILDVMTILVRKRVLRVVEP